MTSFPKSTNRNLGVTAMKEKIYNGSEYVETIAFTSKATGAGGSIQAADDATASFMSNQLGFALDADNKLTASQAGQNAEVVINGLQIEKTTNNFTVNNVTYQLKNTTNSPVSLDVATDVDGIYEKIKDFVTQYNELIDMVNGKLTEKKYRDYTPLTEEQKKDMTEKQIELWEEKAKSGLLKGRHDFKRRHQSNEDRFLFECLCERRIAAAHSVWNYDIKRIQSARSFRDQRRKAESEN